jgi:hypothetical protein
VKSKKAKTSYIVSGANDIAPSDKVIRRSGRRVLYDTEINQDAKQVLKKDARYVVIAHGSPSGTVSLYRTDWGESRPWLFVSMPHPPTGTRMYLYSCHVGNKLPRSLKKCEVSGPLDVVPMPVGFAKNVVLAFFAEIEKLLLDEPKCEPKKWNEKLSKFVNTQIALETEKENLQTLTILAILRRALGYGD